MFKSLWKCTESENDNVETSKHKNVHESGSAKQQDIKPNDTRSQTDGSAGDFRWQHCKRELNDTTHETKRQQQHETYNDTKPEKNGNDSVNSYTAKVNDTNTEDGEREDMGGGWWWSGWVLFLEEDHYLAPDALHVLASLVSLRPKLCPHCHVLALGNYYNLSARSSSDRVSGSI